MSVPLTDQMKLLVEQVHERIGNPPGGLLIFSNQSQMQGMKALPVRIAWRRSYDGVLSDERELNAEDVVTGLEAVMAWEDEVDAEERQRMAKDLWDRDEIQFPRLLAEIVACVEINHNDMTLLCESMDLSINDVNELFERAQKEWERIKEEQRWG